MAIRDFSDWPDDKLPDWVRRSRKRCRDIDERRNPAYMKAEAARIRAELDKLKERNGS